MFCGQICHKSASFNKPPTLNLIQGKSDRCSDVEDWRYFPDWGNDEKFVGNEDGIERNNICRPLTKRLRTFLPFHKKIGSTPLLVG